VFRIGQREGLNILINSQPLNSEPHFRLPLTWKPTHAEGLIRVGPAEDGGYVIREKALKSSDYVVGGGLSDDWRFEEDFEKRSGARVVVYDPTVNSKFWIKRLYGAIKGLRRGKSPFKVIELYMAYNSFFSRKTRQHVRKFIGYEGPNSVSVGQMLAVSKVERDCFLKIDIEGSEYRILDDIVAHRERLAGMVIEFHDVSAHRLMIDKFIGELAPDMQIAHLHANNYGGHSPDGMPIALELTFGWASEVTKPESPLPAYPLPDLDFPCNPAGVDPSIEFSAELRV
tara:strand:+ start:13255 stop:14109 length:855 start_codon:yes stop_codon:yes gene_type:complete